MLRYVMATSPPEFHTDMDSTIEKRSIFGEIFTPHTLVCEMLDLLPMEAFANPAATWLDPGAGKGQFSMALFWRLDKGLASLMPDSEIRRRHITDRMLFMVELQEENVILLRQRFGPTANIYHGDFLDWPPACSFDYVIGNPPYNRNGFKKVPTNIFHKKANDGHAIWVCFIRRALSLMTHGASLLFIVPVLWMRPDKAKMYQFMTKHTIHRIHCLNASQMNKIFGGYAQTPACYFHLSKLPTDNKVLLDNTPFKLNGHPIPTFGADFINCLLPFVAHYGAAIVKKTNMPGKGTLLSNSPSDTHRYSNITTATLNGLYPRLVINYSTTPQAHSGVPKLVLPHKMYGFPYFDREGEYGISNRDNYVIQDYSLDALELFREFLSTKTALYLFECTRYRMRYLEKEAFQFLPDLTRLPDLPRPLTDVSMSIYFGFALEPVLNLHRKNYHFTYT